MQQTKQVALDGPAGAGKSSVAKKLAQRLGYIYIDTGAMYRAVAWLVLQKGVSLTDEAALNALLQGIQIIFGPVEEDGRQQVWCNGADCTEAIRSAEVSNFVSAVSALGPVRQVMVEKQQEIASGNNVVMDGRDIGTVVLPQADLKIFLTASVEERARRRCRELQARGAQVDLATIQAEIAQRDYADSHRSAAPLRKAADAVVVDTSQMDREESLAALITLAKERLGL